MTFALRSLLRRPSLRRPRAVATAGAAIVLAVATPLVVVGCSTTAPPVVGAVDFDQPLRIPPLAESHVQDGVRVFDLHAQHGISELVPEGPTPTLGYNGSYFGPTLVAERGQRVRVDVTNALDETTTVHWHGMHLPAAADGGPHTPIAPGATWHPEWTIDQPAATLWYHPHPHERTRAQTDAGLAGMFLVRDPEEASLALPREYGVDDIPVIVQDRSFRADGSFESGVGDFAGFLGDTIVVNGTVGPFLDVTTERVRLRLLNGSSARMYDFAFADGRSFDLIATDGGLLPVPVPATSIALSPGERAEVVVTMAPGETTTLLSEGPDPALHAGSDSFDVMQLRAAATLAPSPEVPATLAALAPADPADAVAQRSFVRAATTSTTGRWI